MTRWTRTGAATLLIGIVACDGADPVSPPMVEFGDVRTLSDHREIDVSFPSGDAVLAGTIYLPLTGSDLPGVAVNPGSSWDVRPTWAEVSGPVLGLNSAVFGYDKRGLAQSTGTVVPNEPNAAFNILAGDLVAAARVLTEAPFIRPDRVGVTGGSQGGWIVPLAANLDREAISFALITVGGAVSTGQEGRYDVLTGYDVCERTETPLDEITDSLRATPVSGFDPMASIEAMTQPAMWLYGGQDFSHPTQFSVELLGAVEATREKDWTIVVLENANHELIEGGSICQTEGPLADVITPLLAWFDALFPN